MKITPSTVWIATNNHVKHSDTELSFHKISTANNPQLKYNPRNLNRVVKLPCIFPGAPLNFNEAPGNIQDNIDGLGVVGQVYHGTEKTHSLH